MTEIEPVLPAPPLPPFAGTVRPEWVDYNGHMNVAYYVLLFDRATDVLFDAIGAGEAYRRVERRSVFIVETHVTYRRELRAGDPVRIESRLLDHDDKRLRAFLGMVHGESGELAATYEILGLHVDMKSRRAAPFPASVRERIGALAALQASRPRPVEAGLGIGLRSRR